MIGVAIPAVRVATVVRLPMATAPAAASSTRAAVPCRPYASTRLSTVQTTMAASVTAMSTSGAAVGRVRRRSRFTSPAAVANATIEAAETGHVGCPPAGPMPRKMALPDWLATNAPYRRNAKASSAPAVTTASTSAASGWRNSR